MAYLQLKYDLEIEYGSKGYNMKVEFDSRVGEKGQITLPAEMRRQLGIKPKDTVRIVLSDGFMRIERIESTLLKGYGAVTPHRRPEDWRAIRAEVEEGIASEVIDEDK